MSDLSSTPNPTPTPAPAQPKKSRMGMVLVIGGILFLCICVVVGGAVFALNILNSSVTDVFQNINATLENPTIQPTEPPISIPAEPDVTPVYTETAPQEATAEPVPTEPVFQEPDLSSFIPEGGLGDETLRASTWGYVFIYAALSDCEISDTTTTKIEVTQQPDAAGIWKELWTVSCAGGTTKGYDVTFTPSADGTNIQVEEAK
jgi:hypothetical protein